MYTECSSGCLTMPRPAISIELMPSHAIMLEWAQLRYGDSRLGDAAEEPLRLLQNPHGSWATLRQPFCDILRGRLEVIAQLSERYSPQDTLPQGKLGKWFRAADAVKQEWPPQSSEAWRQLIVQQNSLIKATVSQSLTDGLIAADAPREVVRRIRKLVDLDCRWCRLLPMPPAPGTSLNANDYLVLSAYPETLTELTLLGDHFQATIDAFSAIESKRIDSRVEFAGTQLTIAAREFNSLLRLARERWPVEHGRICHHLQRTGEASTKLAEVADDTCSLPVEVAQLNDRIRSAIECIEAIANESADGGLDTSPEKTAGSRDESEVIIDELRSLAALLAKDESTSLIAESLEQAISAVTGRSADDKAEWSQRMLWCLRKVDDRLARGPRRKALRQTQARLRTLLFESEDTGYVLLETQLVGQPLERCEDMVDIKGFVDHASYRSDRIAEVVQPGYILRQNGDQIVVRKAKVKVVK